MPVFVQVLTFRAVRRFDESEDTKRINDVMKELQAKGAKILDVKVALEAGITAVYIITYEANNPISPESGDRRRTRGGNGANQGPCRTLRMPTSETPPRQ